ncbi:MAG: glycosyltransferase [Candidatus Nealsonbacteria bacterium]|nr:glycosyltransferase [Candidatus Nealsonbacteria bacterium]
MNIPETILIGYVFLGCVYWLWIAAGVLRIVCAVPVLRNVDSPEPEVWPKLSVVIPACNEADKIEAAVRSVLGQDYPELEVVLIDDRSTDGTGELVDRLAADDPRVQAVHVTELPDGWLGKVHALDVGVRRATGDWVLFTDADVNYRGDMLRRAVAYCEDRRLDHLAAAPEIWSNQFLADVAVASFLRSFCVLVRCWAVEDPNSGAFVGIGAFNLVRREAFDRTEGFEWLRLEVADDVGLGLMMKRSGGRSCMVTAVGLLGLHWYRTIGEMARGFEKTFASAAQCSVLRLAAICLLSTALELAPLAAFLPVRRVIPGDSSGLWWAGGAMIAMAVFSIVALARWSRGRVLPGLCFPLGVVLNTALLLRAGWLGVWRGGVDWRGTRYPNAVLRRGARVRFPRARAL